MFGNTNDTGTGYPFKSDERIPRDSDFVESVLKEQETQSQHCRRTGPHAEARGFSYHTELVREASTRRRLMNACQMIFDKCTNTAEESGALLDFAEQSISATKRKRMPVT
ncbi:MAG: hypothetical protein JRK53_11265 [Deltaproteobacteria bacterium]|nr:hypothetical protein [Deltaproteobacteria bacterium]